MLEYRKADMLSKDDTNSIDKAADQVRDGVRWRVTIEREDGPLS